jgi:hypothetical protein
VTYDIVGRTYDVLTYDIQEYRWYDVTYDFRNIVGTMWPTISDIVGVTYDVVVTDLRYHMWQESR